MAVWDWPGKAVKAVYNVGKDVTTGQPAYGGNFTPEDYLYGGGGSGPNAYDTAVYYRNLADSEANRFNAGADSAQGTAQSNAQGLVDVGYGARNAGQLYANQAGTLANQFSGASTSVPQMGAMGAQQSGAQQVAARQLVGFNYDPTANAAGSLKAWQGTTQQLGNFNYTPQMGAASAQNVASFSPGTQTRYSQNAYDALMGFANQGPGPSAAEAQLRQGLDANVAAQMALAQSGRGAGVSAQALRQAQFNAADLGQRTNADLATLRANEAATWRGQQAAALGQAGTLGGNIEAQRQGLSGLQLSALQTGAQLGTQENLAANQLRASTLANAAGQYGAQAQATMQAQAQAEQLRLNALQAGAGQYGDVANRALQSDVATQQAMQQWGQLGLNATQTAGNQQTQANQLYLNAITNAGQLQNTAAQTALGYMQSGEAARAGYESAANSLYESEAERRARLAVARMGGSTTASVANQASDTERDKMLLGSVAPAIGAGKAVGLF